MLFVVPQFIFDTQREIIPAVDGRLPGGLLKDVLVGNPDGKMGENLLVKFKAQIRFAAARVGCVSVAGQQQFVGCERIIRGDGRRKKPGRSKSVGKDNRGAQTDGEEKSAYLNMVRFPKPQSEGTMFDANEVRGLRLRPAGRVHQK